MSKSKHKIEVILEFKSKLKEQLKSVSKVIKRNMGRIKDSFKQLKNIGKGGFKKIRENFKGMGRDARAGLGKVGGMLKSMPVQLAVVGAAVVVATAAFVGMVKAIKFAAKIGIEFEQKMADINAILSPTKKEFKQLEGLARDLGKSTAFSASEAAQAFIEMGKLGLTTQQIMAASADVLSLAAASGAELAESAEVMVSTLSQFGLKAEDSTRVADVMAKSFTTSALDMNKFKEAMKSAGPVAAATGVELEETTAALAVLSNSAIAGSRAGTAMKNILIEMSDPAGKVGKQLAKSALNIDTFVKKGKLSKEVGDRITKVGLAGSSVTDKFKLLKAQGLNASQVMDKFGRISGTAAISLIKNSDSIEKYEKSLKKANGAAKEMAEKRLNSIAGKTKQLNSMMEELGLTLFDTFKGATKDLLDDFAVLIQNTTVFVRRNSDMFKYWFEVIGNAIGGSIKWVQIFTLEFELAFKLIALGIVALKEGIVYGVGWAINLAIKGLNLLRDEGNKISELDLHMDGTKELANEVTAIAQDIADLSRDKTQFDVIAKVKKGDSGAIAKAEAEQKELDMAALLAKQADDRAKAATKAAEDRTKAIETIEKMGVDRRIAAIGTERERETAGLNAKFDALKATIGTRSEDLALLETEKRAQLLALKEGWSKEDQEKMNEVTAELTEAQNTQQQNELNSLQTWYDQRKAIIEANNGSMEQLNEIHAKRTADIERKGMQERVKINAALTSNYLSAASNIVAAYASQNKGSKAAAIVQRGIALGQIVVNTARSVVESLPNIPLAVSMGVLGATQFAAAAAAKFNDGGVVGGTSTHGDRVPALVNSGEMILNRKQQGELFQIANGNNSKSNSNVTVGGSTYNVTVGSDSQASEVSNILENIVEEANIALAMRIRELQEDRLTA